MKYGKRSDHERITNASLSQTKDDKEIKFVVTRQNEKNVKEDAYSIHITDDYGYI